MKVLKTAPELVPFDLQYANLPFNAYRLTLGLSNPMVNYSPLRLDALLSFAVVNQATEGRGLAISNEPYYIPLPLGKAWVNSIGLPLWQTTDFMPCGQNDTYSAFWAKRAMRPELIKRPKGGGSLNILTGKGVDKEMLMPIPAQSALTWSCTLVGHAPIIASLLSTLGALGKKRAIGFGVINSWSFEQLESFSFFDNKQKAMRPIPIDYLKVFPLTAERMGWTPPYWLPTSWDLCQPPGQ